MVPRSNRYNRLLLTCSIVSILWIHVSFVSCQLPDDIQRELNQNLAEQARIQAMRQRQQNGASPTGSSTSNGNNKQPAHDPNNYSYQQVSPPIQYSYYQPYGDAAPANQQQQQQPMTGSGAPAAAAPKIDFDLNNLNFDLPQPQARVAEALPGRGHAQAGHKQQHLVPSFTGVGGLPVMQPPAATANQQDNSYTPLGAAPLAPQARTSGPQPAQPQLTEADFKDITGGENYGAPGGNDFGLGQSAGGNSRSSPSDSTDAQLREFGLPADLNQPQQSGRANSNPTGGMNIPDFGAFNPIGGAPSQPQTRRNSGSNGFDDFGNFGAGFPTSRTGTNFDGDQTGNVRQQPQADFDFASQPSNGGFQQDPTSQSGGVGAPGSLQTLLGTGFPGLGGNAASGLDDFARSGNNPQQQGGKSRTDDNALDIADLGDKSDQFSGADLGGFEQPGPQNDQDFNYGSASNQQPKSVPYPDSNPQPVGTLWALTQPQSLTQTRYNALPDKGTYQDYPPYAVGGNEFGAVSEVVENTPRARAPGAGRYATPSASELAPEYAQLMAYAPASSYGARRRPQTYDYSRMPVSRAGFVSRYGF